MVGGKRGKNWGVPGSPPTFVNLKTKIVWDSADIWWIAADVGDDDGDDNNNGDDDCDSDGNDNVDDNAAVDVDDEASTWIGFEARENFPISHNFWHPIHSPRCEFSSHVERLLIVSDLRHLNNYSLKNKWELFCDFNLRGIWWVFNPS